MLIWQRLLVLGLLAAPGVSGAREEAPDNRLREFDAAEPVHRKITKTGTSSAFLMSKFTINKGYPCELAELVFYNGEKRVRTGRSSPFTCGLAQSNMSPLFDGDVRTLVDWPKGKPLFGYNALVQSPVPYAVTHLLIPFGNVLRMDSFPFTVMPYPAMPLSTYVNGTTLIFEKDSDLNQCETTTKGAAQWISRDGSATIELPSNARNGSGELRLPTALRPGQAVGVTVDHGYAMWQGVFSVQVSLGSSSFNLDHESLMTLPNGDKYIAAGYNRSGLLSYSLLLARGSGSRSNTISWAVVGNGVDRSIV